MSFYAVIDNTDYKECVSKLNYNLNKIYDKKKENDHFEKVLYYDIFHDINQFYYHNLII
jgi:hypothetical protein